VIVERYKVLKQVGIGTFGRVLECLDLNARPHRDPRYNYVAIKVVRDVKRYHESAQIEANILRDVNRRGGRGLSHCVVLFDTFSFNGHYAIVQESLGPSLYDYLKRHNYQPFPMVCVQVNADKVTR
jgi:serine/threonine protein kinase